MKHKYLQRYILYIIKNENMDFYGEGDWDYMQQLLKDYIIEHNIETLTFKITKSKEVFNN